MMHSAPVMRSASCFEGWEDIQRACEGERRQGVFYHEILDVPLWEVTANARKLVLRKCKKTAGDYVLYFITISCAVACMYAYNG